MIKVYCTSNPLKILNSILITCVALLILIPFIGCSPENTNATSGEKDIVVKINKSTISLEEFNELMKFEAYVDPELDLSAENRDRFLDYLIRKELMIQEASRLKLDHQEAFVKSIEKYWESTLIRNLIEQKTKEFKKKILITDDEIKSYYSQNKAEFNESFGESKEMIRKILESHKLDKKIEQWNVAIRESADIVIDEKLLQGK